MAHDGIYGKLIESVVKQMIVLSYLRKKWKLKKRNDNKEIASELRKDREIGCQRRGRGDPKGGRRHERIADRTVRVARQDKVEAEEEQR
jgi:hypothetical protein